MPGEEVSMVGVLYCCGPLAALAALCHLTGGLLSALNQPIPMGAVLDKVGYWTEIKLHILKEYASAYAAILKKQKAIKHVAYIDAFAGAGTHVSKRTGEQIDGSPTTVLGIEPRFSHYHFIEMDPARARNIAVPT